MCVDTSSSCPWVMNLPDLKFPSVSYTHTQTLETYQGLWFVNLGILQCVFELQLSERHFLLL